jgi:pilus assembly protein Flp/PilA
MPLPGPSCKPQHDPSRSELLWPCMALPLLTFNANGSVCRAVIRESVVMNSMIRRFVEDESGATAVEYAVIAGIIALGLIVSLGAIRDNLNEIFNNASDGMK